MNPKQKEQLRQLVGPLSAKERKEIVRQAAELRTKHQRDPQNPRARWCVDRWTLHLLESRDADPTYETGIVVSVAKGRATVRIGAEDRPCDLTRELTEVQQSAIAPGDTARVEPYGAGWRVREVLPRRTWLRRMDPHFKERERTIVANIDWVVIVVSVVAPPLHPRLIDRYLAAILQGGAEACIVVNKTDLHPSEEALRRDLDQLAPYEEMGVPVLTVSSVEGQGVDPIRRALAGKTACFVGHSGVGKSSLLNAVTGRALAATGSVAEVGKGRHTTTRSELVEFGDLRIIDTPGVREFNVDFRTPGEVAACFREFADVGACRFGNCQHLEEPGCRVREAVHLGEISRPRYRSYRRLVAALVAPTGGDDDEPPDERRPSFVCGHCGSEVPRAGGGTEHRNHCPRCLHSRHLDAEPGDRASGCGGLMEPITVWVRKGGEWAIVHRCRHCGQLSSNRIAADDNEALLLSLAVRPLSQPPFPLDRLTLT